MADAFMREVHCLLGLPFDATDTEAVVTVIQDAVAHRRKCVFSTPNLNFLVACLRDEPFRDSVIESDLSIADGMPLVWVARMLGVPIRERVAGSNVFERLRRAEVNRMSVYFFGGPPGAARAACDRLNADSSGMRCVGFESPGFGSVDDVSAGDMIDRVNESGADFVVVALGARKGQEWIVRNRDRLSAPVISHLGAVLNFVAGSVRRAPPWMQRAGLEWVWRIREEPRLVRRYFVDGLSFLRLIATRVFPYWWYQTAVRTSAKDLADARFERAEAGQELEIRLCGAWTLQNLQPLRECLASAALTDMDVSLVMKGVTYVDSAFLGLILLLYGDRKRRGRRLRCIATTQSVRRIYRYACVEFLLGEIGRAVV